MIRGIAQRKMLLLINASLLVACGTEPGTGNNQIDPVPTVEVAVENVWQQASRRGVTFRAIGQEPGWHLEITDGEQILLVTNYGSERLMMPYTEPLDSQTNDRTEYVIEEFDILIDIRDEACADVMSGEEFAVAVTINAPGRTLKGCGRALNQVPSP